MALSMDQHDDRNALLERIQDLDQEVRKKDIALKEERRRTLQQEVESILRKTQEKYWPVREGGRYMQEQDSRIQHALDRAREANVTGPRDLRQKRRKRDLFRERHIKKRQRVLQQQRDLALQGAETKEKELQRAKDKERQAKERSSALLQEREQTIQQAEERHEQAKERARAFQQERDEAIQWAEERHKQARERVRELLWERNRALVQASQRSTELLQEKTRSIQLRLEGNQEALERERELQQERDRAIQWAEERDKKAQERDRQAHERDKQAQERARALQQERDKLLRQAWQREKAVKQERDKALQRLREIDPLLQPSTLGDFIKECHASLFSKLTIEPNVGRGSDATTTNLRGKWQPKKVIQWTDFLSEQRLIFGKVCEVFPSELREFPRPATVRENGTKIVPIADEKTLERFIDVSIAEPVKNIITKLQSVDKLGRVCPGDVDVDFVIHPDHAKPLEIDSTPSRPIEPEPVRTRYCIYRDGTNSMASATSLYVWEPKVPYDLTVEDLRAALRPTVAFGGVAARAESSAVENAGEPLQSVTTAEKRVKRVVTEIYHNMMESCLEFGILTTGQAIVFVHVNWDDPQTLYYHIAEPALDVARASEGDAAFFSAVGQYVAFTIMALTKRRKHLQERRMRVFKTLSKWGIPSRLLSADYSDAASSTKTVHNDNGKQHSAPDQPYPYCSQKCLLGLVQEGLLDPKCPNVTLHCQRGPGEAAHQKRHPVDHAEWLRLLREQFKQSIDVGITYEGVVGAVGAFFKVTLLAYGYTFVSKGTVSAHIEHLEHEARVYERLKAIQGRYVPVFLGTIDLRTMQKDYWIYFETYVVHMMFFSWGGILFHVHRAGMDELETLHEVPWIDEGVRALKAVHNEGVLHCDVRWGNVLFNSETKGIMVIDFERAELLDGHATGLPEKDTRNEDGLRKTDKQLRIEACNEERAEEEEREMFGVIEDALGIDSDDSSELEDSDF
ncbi:hypothetical protein E4U13_007829 [Claviceps humidiphila]|uniref:Protein kinase domain-containing protein n=1 Tax=Claviceps humidiphila TaxID=1294629 RepID=A0A9P7PV00_9HYPO|nr:hypothetical protein E4U13_007829 [Claviceps humidiphila]